MQRVVCVDDEEFMLDLISTIIQAQSNSYEVITYFEAEGVLANLSIDRPDLILLDYMMPEMNGADLARALRRGGYQNTIIGISAAKVERLLLDAGCDAFLEKPFTASRLLALLHHYLED